MLEAPRLGIRVFIWTLPSDTMYLQIGRGQCYAPYCALGSSSEYMKIGRSQCYTPGDVRGSASLICGQMATPRVAGKVLLGNDHDFDFENHNHFKHHDIIKCVNTSLQEARAVTAKRRRTVSLGAKSCSQR